MQHSFRPLAFAHAAFSLAAAIGSLLNGQSTDENQDRISKLDRKLANGETTLAFSEKAGYLPSLLKKLDIHTDSQILVFSKTSFQQQYISPQKPRAIYFNDDTIVSFVQEAPVFELISMDPADGLQFFTMEQEKDGQTAFQVRACVVYRLSWTHQQWGSGSDDRYGFTLAYRKALFPLRRTVPPYQPSLTSLGTMGRLLRHR